MRFLVVAFALTVLGCHRWIDVVRSDGLPRDAPIAVTPVQVTANTLVTGAATEDGLVVAKQVATEIDARLVGLIVHDGARVYSGARTQLHVTILGVKPAQGPWFPQGASLTARVELRTDNVVTDASVIEVTDRRRTGRLGSEAARDIADWVAYRRNSW